MADPQLSWLDRIRKRLNFNRLDRMEQHYHAIRSQLAPKNANDREEVAFFTQEFERYARVTERLSNIRLFFYIVLYATILVNVLKVIPFLSVLVTFIELSGAIFGTTLALIVVFVLSVKIRLNLELMQDCMSHLIVIYHKNPKRDTKAMLDQAAKAI